MHEVADIYQCDVVNVYAVPTRHEVADVYQCHVVNVYAIN